MKMLRIPGIFQIPETQYPVLNSFLIAFLFIQWEKYNSYLLLDGNITHGVHDHHPDTQHHSSPCPLPPKQ